MLSAERKTMSSLAAARADNYYNPPDWDPSKESRNKVGRCCGHAVHAQSSAWHRLSRTGRARRLLLLQYHGSHGALGNRARKLDQGILIIRFEMPFNVWCTGCGHLIGKGVRFNAEKKQIGAYHSTKIWSFSMRAPCCQQRIEVHTDPKAAEYVVVSGARRKAEAAGDDDSGQGVLDTEAGAALADPLARLEHAGEDVRMALDSRESLARLQEDSAERHRDDYAANRQLRAVLRGARREEKARDARRKELGLPEHVVLAAETAGDRLRAAAVTFGGEGFERGRRHARRQALGGGIFSAAAVAAATGKRSAGGGVALEQQLPAGGLLEHKHRRLAAAVKLRLSAPGSEGAPRVA